MVGRNDPCPCGSGKKYKRCCLSAATGQPAFTQQDRESALSRLFRFADAPRFERDRDVADMLFWPPEFDLAALKEVLDEEGLREVFFRRMLWLCLDVEIDKGLTIADLLLTEQADRLSPAERAYLETARRTRLDLYEVQRVEPGRGLVLGEEWSGERIWVRERSASYQLARWDLMAARLFPGASGDIEMEGDSITLPARHREEIVADLETEHRKWRRDLPGGAREAFLKRVGFKFHHYWVRYVLAPPMPRIVTPEGNDVELGRSVYDILDREALLEGLAAGTAFQATESNRWEHREGDRILATIQLTRTRLILEGHSRQRLARTRGLLKTAAGKALRHRATHYTPVEKALAEAGPPPELDLPAELQDRLVREHLDRHYREWPDLPVPALGNRTPRHAARLKSVRPRLVQLLKSFENAEERKERRGERAYDFGWLWEELGLDRPRL